MPEEKKQLSWKEKFLANRATFESVLFEKELVMPAREKLSVGLLGAAGIWLLGVLLLAQWAFRQGCFFSAADASGFERINAYAAHLSSGGFWSLFKPMISGFELDPNPPLYYLSYFPVFKFLTSDLTSAMLAVNSFYLLVIALSIFLAVKKSRNNFSGWLGTAFTMAMPFTLEVARHPEPELAAMAMAAAAYSCYINSEDFEHSNWSFWSSVFFSLGFFAHRHFWVYALPLAPFIMPAMAGYLARNEILKGLLLGLALNLQWYSVFLVSRFLGFYRPESQSAGFWTSFGLSVQAASLPFFIIGGLALLWMYFSVFMPYANKKVVAAWFWVPYLALTYLVGTTDPKLFYPALFPLAIAAAVMTPNFIRKYLFWLALGLTFLNQSGLVAPFSFGRYFVAGLEAPQQDEQRGAEILESLTSQGPGPSRVLVAGGGNSFNSASFSLLAGERGVAKNMVFYNRSDLAPAFADYIVYRTPSYGAVPSRPMPAQVPYQGPMAIRRPFGRETDNTEVGHKLKTEPAEPKERGPLAESDLSSVFSESWFDLLFEETREFELKDTSKVLLYAKRRQTKEPFAAGKYTIKKYEIGGLNLENAKLTLKNFDPQKGIYSNALVFAPSASYEGIDIYGLALELTDLRIVAAGPAHFNRSAGGENSSVGFNPRFLNQKGWARPLISDLVVSGVGSVKVVSAQISAKAVERFLAGRLKFLGNPNVALSRTITLHSDTPREINAKLSLAVKRNSFFELKLDSFDCEGYQAPEFFVRNFIFNYDFALSPYVLSFEAFKINGQIFEIGSPKSNIRMPLTGRFY
ncbi:MAG: hypothetical protein NTX59_10475 [Elusimicrobia bacterium]|nr:hypothetical protein [Elusimicrobiota bacterium]